MYGAAFIVALVLLVVVTGLFVTYVVLDRNHVRNVEATLKEAPLVLNALPKIRTALEQHRQDEEPDLVGLIVETRDHVNLVPVIRNFQHVLPDTPIYVFHGVTNEAKLRAAFGDSLNYVPIESDNMTIRQYNYLMTHPQLWQNLSGRHVLVFQTDSVLFSRSRVKIQDFFQYDYVGAPWNRLYRYYVRNAFMFRGLDRHSWGGNGGLSLRRRSTMVDITERYPYLSIPYSPEDVYFSNAMGDMADDEVTLPDRETSAQLFFETVDTPELPLGCHKFLPSKHLEHITDDEQAIIERYQMKNDTET
jgi:hypothetical protein